MNKVIVGVGSNIDPQENIAKARQMLADHFDVICESTFVRTRPIGYEQQADFINGAVLIQTDLGLEQLRESFKGIENMLGRERTAEKFGPRTIDLDIVVWNDKVIDNDFYEREYLRNAVLELEPELKY